MDAKHDVRLEHIQRCLILDNIKENSRKLRGQTIQYIFSIHYRHVIIVVLESWKHQEKHMSLSQIISGRC